MMSDMEAREAMVTLLTGNTTACWDSALLPNEYLAGKVADAILASGLVVTTAEADRRVADILQVLTDQQQPPTTQHEAPWGVYGLRMAGVIDNLVRQFPPTESEAPNVRTDQP